MTDRSDTGFPPAPWGIFDAFILLALFFYIPGWVSSAMEFLPDSFRNRWLTVQESEVSDFFDLQKTAEKEDSSLEPERGSRFLKLTEKILKPESLVKLYRETSASLGSSGTEKQTDKVLRGEHPLTVLMAAAGRIPRLKWVFFLCFTAAVITAPITEELLFRVVFQRGLEHSINSSLVTLLIPAFLFAVIHFRQPGGIGSIGDLNRLLNGIAASVFGHLLIIFCAIAWLRGVRSAAWSDLGFTANRIFRSFLIGIGTFLICFPLMMLAQLLFRHFFPDIVSDPIPIFVLALGLGILFRRRRNFISIYVMHASLNLTSFCGILFLLKQNQL